MADTLTVTKRTDVGSRASQRLRCNGSLPVVLYGHGEPSVSLSVTYDEFNKTQRHSAKVFELAGEEKGQALLQDMQWDTFGRYVLHADLLRISADDRVHIEVEVATKGEAPGEAEGGNLVWVNHKVDIEVAPSNIPESLHVDLSKVQIGSTVTAGDIFDLPEGAVLQTAPERVILNCSAPKSEEEEDATALGAVEPEVIGKKAEDDSDGGDS